MGTDISLEVETKYSVSATAVVPALGSLRTVTTVGDTVEHQLSALYFDTEDLRLTRSRMTLRRRTGGTDAGWHLKLPGGGSARTEVTAELDEADPHTSEDPAAHIPEFLRSQVRAVTRGQKLILIAQVDNRRLETTLLGKYGDTVAEFCDDHVQGTSFLPGGQSSTWREWEVELSEAVANTGPGRRLLESADQLLRTAGANDPDFPSKLVAALGDSINNAPTPPQPARLNHYDEGDEAFSGVLTSMQHALKTLVRADAGSRRGEPKAIDALLSSAHDLHHLLGMFSDVFDRDAAASAADSVRLLRQHLEGLIATTRQLWTSLSVRDHLEDLVAADRAGLVDDTTRDRLLHGINETVDRRLGLLVKTLDKPWHMRALSGFDELLADPPIPGHRHRRKATAIVVREVKRAFIAYKKDRRFSPAKSEVAAMSLTEQSARLKQRHVIAERLLNAAEVAARFTTYPSDGLVEESRRLLKSLVSVETSIQTRATIERFRRAAAGDREDTFGYGVFYQAETQRSDRAESVADKRFKALRSNYKRFVRAVNTTT